MINKKKICLQWFKDLQDLICNTVIDLEKEYGNQEVWSTAIFFKELSYNSYEKMFFDARAYIYIHFF